MSVKIVPAFDPPVAVSEVMKGAAEMGEVRVQVKLTNAGDAVLVRRGLLTPDQVRSYTADALIDTGAISSVIPIHIVQQLGLELVGKARAEYSNGMQEEVEMTEPVGFEIKTRRATEEALVLGDEVLIGQTILERMDLLVDCANRRVIGNPAHPDQPVLKVK
jgi:clan AA aspartic protease